MKIRCKSGVHAVVSHTVLAGLFRGHHRALAGLFRGHPERILACSVAIMPVIPYVGDDQVSGGRSAAIASAMDRAAFHGREIFTLYFTVVKNTTCRQRSRRRWTAPQIAAGPWLLRGAPV